MTEAVRLLTNAGMELFAAYVAKVRHDPALAPPHNLLYDEATSILAPFLAEISKPPERNSFTTAYELGVYLSATVFKNADKASISRNHRLWNWLSLYLFDELRPPAGGTKTLLEDAAYYLTADFNYQRYYRHLVRSAWIAVEIHGTHAKVLLTPIRAIKGNGVAIRNEINMQLAATQAFVESKSIVELAYMLYFNPTKNRHKPGSGSQNEGSPRRLTAILNQLDLTYDLHECPPQIGMTLLPKEFLRFTKAS